MFILKKQALINFIKNKGVYLLVAVAAILYGYFETQGKGDFYIFLSAADDLNSKANIYEKKYVDGYHYFYSVFFALILKPFVGLSFTAIKFCWLLINEILFLHLFYLLIQSEFVKVLSSPKRVIFLLMVVLFSSRFFIDNIHTSQITILILWCCIYGLYCITQEKNIKGAFILALGINIKLLPLVFLPYLIYRGYFKAFFATVFFYILFLFTPCFFIGHEYNVSLLKTWFHLINPANQNHVLDVEERSFHGLSTLLSTLLVKNVPDVYALDLKRNICDVSLSALASVLLLVRLTLVTFTLYFLRPVFFAKAKNSWQQYIEVSYILLIVPLIFPHQQAYAFLFTLPAVCCVFYYLILSDLKLKAHPFILCAVIFIFLCFGLKLFLGMFNDYYDHYKIVTYGALLLIPLLVWLRVQVKKNPNFF